MLDHIDALGSHHGLPLRSWNNLRHIILHDKLILIHHDILQDLMSCYIIVIGRLIINDVTHHFHIAEDLVRYLSLPEGTTQSCMPLSILKSIMKPWWPLLVHGNISRYIHWLCCLYWLLLIVWRTNNLTRGFCTLVPWSLLLPIMYILARISRYFEGYLFIKSNISTNLNMTLSWNVDLVSLLSLAISHKGSLLSRRF